MRDRATEIGQTISSFSVQFSAERDGFFGRHEHWVPVFAWNAERQRFRPQSLSTANRATTASWICSLAGRRRVQDIEDGCSTVFTFISPSIS